MNESLIAGLLLWGVFITLVGMFIGFSPVLVGAAGWLMISGMLMVTSSVVLMIVTL